MNSTKKYHHGEHHLLYIDVKKHHLYTVHGLKIMDGNQVNQNETSLIRYDTILSDNILRKQLYYHHLQINSPLINLTDS